MKNQSNEERFVALINQIGSMYGIPRLKGEETLAKVTSHGPVINDRLIKVENYDITCSAIAASALEYLKVGLPMTLEDLFLVVNDSREETEPPEEEAIH